MKYDRIEIVKIKPGKFNHKSIRYRVTEYHSGVPDTTGLGGTWEGSGLLCHVYEVGDYLVAMSIFHGGYPTHVWKNVYDMMDYFSTLTKNLKMI